MKRRGIIGRRVKVNGRMRGQVADVRHGGTSVLILVRHVADGAVRWWPRECLTFLRGNYEA